MDKTLRECYMAIAYCYCHPTDSEKKKLLEALMIKAWFLGYPRSYFDIPTRDILATELTDEELKYIFDK